MDTLHILYGFLSGMCFGGLIGMAGEAARWRRNADTYMRIESKGKLFKVHHDRPPSDESLSRNKSC